MMAELLTDPDNLENAAREPAHMADEAPHLTALLKAAQCEVTAGHIEEYHAALDADLFWIDDHTAWMPVAESGAPLLAPSNSDAAMALLDQYDPLLSRVEAAIGLPLDPATIAPLCQWQAAAAAYDTYHLSIEDGAFILLIGHDHPRHSRWREAAAMLPPDPAQLNLPARLIVNGGKVDAQEIQALAIGDWLLLPQNTPATLALKQPSPGAAQQLESLGCPAIMTGIFTPDNGWFEMVAAGNGDDAYIGGAPAIVWQFHTAFHGINAARLLHIAAGNPAMMTRLTDGQRGEIFIGDRAIALGSIALLRDRMAVAVEEIYGDEADTIPEQEG